ncbi:MAG TPA: ABC transporter ATP-binding protein [Acidimicrobiia bacterium]|jgi:ATP-binding cassette subfamily B protein
MRDALRPHKKWSRIGIAAGGGWAAARVAIPLLAAAAIDRSIEHTRDPLWTWIVILVGAGVFQGLCTGMRRYAAFRLAYRVETDMRMQLVAHLQRLHFAYHDTAQTGQLMANAASDLNQVNQTVVLIPLTIASTIMMVAVIVVLVIISPGLCVFALIALPFLQLSAARFSRRMFPIGMSLQNELSRYSGSVEESITGIRVVKGFGAERRQIASVDNHSAGIYERSIAAARERAWFLPIIDLLPALGLAGILWYGGHQVLEGHLQIGDILAANLYVLMLIWPLRMLGQLIGQIPRSIAASARIHDVLATDPQIVDAPEAQSLASGGADLRFEHVTFGYGNGRPVLDGLDLVIPAGQAVALVGATAAGKSTVARLIPRFYDVDDGRILIGGVDVRELRLAELRRAIGIVFEDTFLFTESVRDNIAFADPGAPMEAVRRAARLAGAEEFIEGLPGGFDTLLGQHGYTLSGGQRQRVAIARAVLADPKVLILDDATSSVDPTKEHEIRAALAEVMRDRTTLIIAHRPATIALADRVVLLDGGRIVADGTHDDLLASSERYREVLARAELSAAHVQADSSADDGDEFDRDAEPEVSR